MSRHLFVACTSCSSGNTGNDRDELIPFGDHLVLLVADGAQGQAGGTAAQIAADYVKAHAAQIASAFSGAGCCQALEDIDRAIFTYSSGGETTAVLIVMRPDSLVGASVGDSEAHLIHEREVFDLTENQVRRPFLGTGRARPIGFGPAQFEGRLLVATDGLFKYGKASVREDLVRSAPIGEAAWRLVDSVRLGNGHLHDDVTVYVVEGQDDGPRAL